MFNGLAQRLVQLVATRTVWVFPVVHDSISRDGLAQLALEFCPCLVEGNGKRADTNGERFADLFVRKLFIMTHAKDTGLPIRQTSDCLAQSFSQLMANC